MAVIVKAWMAQQPLRCNFMLCTITDYAAPDAHHNYTADFNTVSMVTRAVSSGPGPLYTSLV